MKKKKRVLHCVALYYCVVLYYIVLHGSLYILRYSTEFVGGHPNRRIRNFRVRIFRDNRV